MARLAFPLRRAGALAVITLLLPSCGGRSDIGSTSTGDAGVESGTEGGADATPDAPVDVIYDHVNDISGCNPDTCGGCCDDQGNCRTGLETEACGIGGFACVDCGAINAACNAGTHQCGPPQSCGPMTCPDGCCTDGVCVDGTSEDACGTGGAICTQCKAGTACDPVSRICVDAQKCGPWSCDGCCDAYGACNWGGEDWACGSGGQLCVDCLAFNDSCDPDTFTCSSPETCAPWNCQGCCTNTYPSTCVDGTEQWQCGHGGEACLPCAPGQTCEWLPSGGGTCGGAPPPPPVDAGPGCGPWNCNGCCTPNGQCRPGKGNKRCGAGGEICEDCTEQNLVCENGDCVP